MNFFQNTCKPEGLGGKIMVTTMNIGGHAALAKWGRSYLTLESDLELSPKDILVDAVFMTTVREIMKHGESIPDYMLSGIQGNFTNFPMTHFYYGSNEVLYAEAPYFAKAFEKYGAACAFHIGQGLCHCYPTFDFYPEGKQAQEEIIGLLRNDSHTGEQV